MRSVVLRLACEDVSRFDLVLFASGRSLCINRTGHFRSYFSDHKSCGHAKPRSSTKTSRHHHLHCCCFEIELPRLDCNQIVDRNLGLRDRGAVRKGTCVIVEAFYKQKKLFVSSQRLLTMELTVGTSHAVGLLGLVVINNRLGGSAERLEYLPSTDDDALQSLIVARAERQLERSKGEKDNAYHMMVMYPA